MTKTSHSKVELLQLCSFVSVWFYGSLFNEIESFAVANPDLTLIPILDFESPRFDSGLDSCHNSTFAWRFHETGSGCV